METAGERDRFEVRPRGNYETAWRAFGGRCQVLYRQRRGKATAARAADVIKRRGCSARVRALYGWEQHAVGVDGEARRAEATAA